MPFILLLPVALYGIKIGASVISARYALVKAKQASGINLTKAFTSALKEAAPHIQKVVIARSAKAYNTLQELLNGVRKDKQQAEDTTQELGKRSTNGSQNEQSTFSEDGRNLPRKNG